MKTIPARAIPSPRHFASHPERPFSMCGSPVKLVAQPVAVSATAANRMNCFNI
jgi:hypothetical protein